MLFAYREKPVVRLCHLRHPLFYEKKMFSLNEEIRKYRMCTWQQGYLVFGRARTRETLLMLHAPLMKHCSISRGLNHLPYRLSVSISVSMAVIKDFSTHYMKALELKHICC